MTKIYRIEVLQTTEHTTYIRANSRKEAQDELDENGIESEKMHEWGFETSHRDTNIL